MFGFSFPDSAMAAKEAKKVCVGCTVGKVGPGGGIVFYDAGSRQKWGRYLEAAPANWSGSGADPKTPWCNINNASVWANLNKGLLTGIGQGRPSTHIMRTHCSSGAGVLASAFNGGGKSDWFLPSKYELNLMYANRTIIGGLTGGTYWSSCEDYGLAAWFQSFVDGSTGSIMKSTNESVRPIRAY